ncbi:MAG: hypothetical protein KC468_04480, partial [Myxococcales bacterium]|nr:hypothetical protein [Myxococcales bacterium]
EAPPFLELYEHADDPLAGHREPLFSGPLERLSDRELARAVAELGDRVAEALARPGPLELELALEPVTDRAWLVQARPLSRPLVDDAAPFFAALTGDERDALRAAADSGVALELDAEHNPAALSPAHAWLVRWQRARRPTHDRAHVLGGWLYYEDSLERAGPPRPAPQELDELGAALRVSVETLQRAQLPAARARLASLTTALARAELHELVDLFQQALDDLLDVVDAYHEGRALRRRARALLASLPASPPPADLSPACLADREAYLDVLPIAWDIASPPLADAITRPSADATRAAATGDPLRDATLLCELDDHLFALGLAPARRVYLRAAELLGLAPEDIFLLDGHALRAALTGASRADELRARLDRARAQQRARDALDPPRRLLHGRPLPARATGRRLRGIPFGPSRRGPLAIRRDLAALLDDPPPPGAIVAIPALTAQAAVVLHALGVRAVCCEHGGVLSHAAVMARELELSALIGCRGCTSLTERARVWLDTRGGALRPLPARARDTSDMSNKTS